MSAEGEGAAACGGVIGGHGSKMGRVEFDQGCDEGKTAGRSRISNWETANRQENRYESGYLYPYKRYFPFIVRISLPLPLNFPDKEVSPYTTPHAPVSSPLE